MKKLNQEEIEDLLRQLGEELAARKFSITRIMLIGGAFMISQVGNREVTEDVDIFPIPAMSEKEAKKFKSAVIATAKQFGVQRNWLNDVAFSMIAGLGPDPIMTLWQVFGVLEVYIPPEEYILALKLFAYRSKDYDDINALLERLNVETRSQAQVIVDQYIYPRWQQEYRLANTLEEIFGE